MPSSRRRWALTDCSGPAAAGRSCSPRRRRADGLVLLYNLSVAGHLAGGYGLMGKAAFVQYDLLSGLGGLLFSPTRGLFVFSPFLLFLALAWRHLPRDRGERGLTLALCAGVVLQILLYAKTDWRTGILGAALLTDLLPLLLWMLVPVVAALRGIGRTASARGRRRGRHRGHRRYVHGPTGDLPVPAVPTRCGPRGTGKTHPRRFLSAWPRAGELMMRCAAVLTL